MIVWRRAQYVARLRFTLWSDWPEHGGPVGHSPALTSHNRQVSKVYLTCSVAHPVLEVFGRTFSRAFYVPGVAPTDYKDGDDVAVKAVKMTSAHTQVCRVQLSTDSVLVEYWLKLQMLTLSWHVSDVLNVWHLWNRNDALSPISLSSPFPQLPYEYYSLPLCEPPNGVRQYSSENLGQIIRWALDQFYWRKVFALARSKKDMNYEWNTAYSRGERIVNTPYKIGMNKNVECAVLCKDKK